MTSLVSAIVPMRHASERVPGKNYRSLGGRPLYHHVVTALLATPGVAEVIIDTDSDVILRDAAEHFPMVRLVIRPEHLRDGHTPMNDVLAHSIGHAVSDVVLQTHSTNPFVQPQTYQSAIDLYFDTPSCDSLFGVSRIQGRLWTADLKPLNHDPVVLARTQDLPPVYLENSCFYLFSKQTFSLANNRIGASPRVHEVPLIEAIDIDDETEFRLAEAVVAAGIVGRP